MPTDMVRKPQDKPVMDCRDMKVGASEQPPGRETPLRFEVRPRRRGSNDDGEQGAGIGSWHPSS